jgi:hypothetical protein
MNIQKLISSIRQAKKRRPLNDFHRVPRGGVDVHPDNFNDTLLLLKGMFKQFKAINCFIEISFYGEILITINENGHRFELSITNRQNIKNPDKLLKELEKVSFLKLGSIDINDSLTVSIKTMRRRSEWKHLLVSEYNNDETLLTEVIIKEIKQRVRYYSNLDLGDSTLNDVSTEDKLALIHFGGALYGPSSMLFYLSKYLRKVIYVKDLSITRNQITVNKSYFTEETNHYFGKKEEAFFDKFLFNFAAMRSDDDNSN